MAQASPHRGLASSPSPDGFGAPASAVAEREHRDRCEFGALDGAAAPYRPHPPCPWPKRRLRRFAGTIPENLRSHLDWLVCLFRANRAKDRWPGTERAVRHLLQVEARYRS